jgi:hypothetical protein
MILSDECRTNGTIFNSGGLKQGFVAVTEKNFQSVANNSYSNHGENFFKANFQNKTS